MLKIFQRVPHVYTTPSSPDAARCWVPCLDNLWDRHSWEFEFVVPKYLEEPDPATVELEGEETNGETNRSPTVVICSGELVEQVLFFSFVPLLGNSQFWCRWLIPSTLPRLFFCFLNLYQRRLSMWPSLQDPFTFGPFPWKAAV